MNPEALDKAFLLSKILGCFPFSFDGGEVRVNCRLLIFSLCVKLVFFPQPILTIFHGTFVISQSKVHLITGKVSYCLVAIFSYFSYACYFGNKRKVAVVLRKFAKADEILKKLGQETYSDVSLCHDALMLIGILSLPCIRTYVTPQMTVYKAYQLAYMVYMMMSLFMMVQPFVRVVENLTARARRLRVYVFQAPTSGSTYDRNRNLQSVIQLHHLFCSTSDVLNEIFSVNLLLVVFMVFFMITTYAYYAMTSGFNSYAVSIIHGIIVVYYTTIICLIAIHCDSLSKESKEFSSLLYHTMVTDKTKDILNNKKLRLHISMKRVISFTACGLFELDNALLHSMIAAATTYLVILLDFGE